MKKPIVHLLYQTIDSPKGSPDGIKEKPTRLMLQYEKDGKPQIMFLTPKEEKIYKEALPQIEQKVSNFFKMPLPEDKIMESAMRKEMGKKGPLNYEEIREMALHSPDLADMRNILRMTSDGKLSDTLWEGLKKMVTPGGGDIRKGDEQVRFLFSVLVDSRKKGLPLFEYLNTILGTQITANTPVTVGKDTIRLEDFLKMKTIQDFQEEVIAVKLAAQAGRDALKKEIKPKP